MKRERGITLIALVITIIVLLILAGVSISLVLGDNGVLTKATGAIVENRAAAVEEERDMWKADQEISNIVEGSSPAETLEDLLERLGPNGQNILMEDEIDRIIGNASKGIRATGQVTIGSRTIVFRDPLITDFIQIGDYIDYNPTKANAEKTENVEAGKLVYVSPTGTGKSHGNGYTSTYVDESNSANTGGQKFTTKSNLKWRVLSVTNEKIEIIPTNSIKNDQNTTFRVRGAIGYLYYEQELNEISKIYGYGYGADKNMITEYEIGGPLDTVKRTLTGSGARSISSNDIYKAIGIYKEEDENGIEKLKYSDGTLVSDGNGGNGYGRSNYPSSNIYYPTMTTDDGVSTTKRCQKFKKWIKLSKFE